MPAVWCEVHVVSQIPIGPYMSERKPIGLTVPHRHPDQIRVELERRVEELEAKVRQLEAVIRKLDRAALVRKTR